MFCKLSDEKEIENFWDQLKTDLARYLSDAPWLSSMCTQAALICCWVPQPNSLGDDQVVSQATNALPNVGLG